MENLPSVERGLPTEWGLPTGGGGGLPTGGLPTKGGVCMSHVIVGRQTPVDRMTHAFRNFVGGQ